MTILASTPPYDTSVQAVRRGFLVLFARFGHLIKRWVAAMIAHREREATLVALRHLKDRGLRDIGIYRCQIGDPLAEIAQTRMRPLPESGVSVMSSGGPITDPRPTADLQMAASADRFVRSVGTLLGKGN